MSPAESGGRPIWRWPVLIGLASGFGLVCALLADGAWDVAGAGSLAVPGVIALWLIGKFVAGRRPALEE